MLLDPITGAPLMARTASAAMADMKKTTRPRAAKEEVEAGAPAPRAKKAAPTEADMMNMSAPERKAARAAAAPKGKAFIPPKNLALCADAYYSKRAQRLELEKQAAVIAAEENACREFLINNLPKSQASGISGKLANVRVENKDVYGVKDWDAVWGYVLKNVKKMPALTGMFQRRINEGMVKEMVENGKVIPGVEKTEVPVLRMSKL